jgi:hypothetical protein
MMLEFFSSSNNVVNTKRAVAECLENALSPDDTDCDLIIFHTTVGHDFEELLSEMRYLAPRARILGCTGAGIIGKEGASETMRSLAVMAIRGPIRDLPIAGIDSIVGLDPYQTGVRIATDLKRQNSDVSIVMLFTSPLDILPANRAIAGIEEVLGQTTRVIGGSAYDRWFLTNWQFLDDSVFERGTVAVGFADPSLEVVMRADHGFVPSGEPFTVTRSEGSRVYELDGTQAWRALAARAGVDEGVDTKSSEAAALWAVATELPEELHEAYGSRHLIHLGSAFKQSDGSIMLGETCPAGAKIWLAERNEELIFSGTDRIVQEIIAESDDRVPIAVFNADCAIRGRFMFNRFLKEEIVARMQSPFSPGSDVPWLGFYSGGEFCAIGDQNRYQAFTTAICALYRRTDL